MTSGSESCGKFVIPIKTGDSSFLTIRAELINKLNEIPAVDLENASSDDVAILEKARDLCAKHLKFISGTHM